MPSIAKQVKKVIDYSQGINSNVDTLMLQWEKGKQSFIQLFGGKNIYSAGHVSIMIGPEREKTLVYRFIEEVEDIFCLTSLAKFLRDNVDNFFDNVVVNNEENRKVPIGMKMLRAFKFFIEDENLLRRVQDRASYYLQQDKIEGELCLSVHPLDFLSLSENNHNWRSCHALDGEFRAGNLSYMCDASTVVCYIKSESPDEVLERFPSDVPWNSKKWRCLLHFSDNKDMMFMSKHYPFHLHSMQGELRAILQRIPVIRDLFPMYSQGWSTYCVSDSDLWYDYVKVGGSLVAITDLITEATPTLQYNDVMRSSKYEHLYVVHPRYSREATENMPHFHIGSSIPCLICGESFISDSERMYCDTCDNGYDDYDLCSCDICGRTYHEDEAVEVEGYYICPHCADASTYRCPHCGELIFDNSKVYHAGTDEYYCSDCIELLDEKRG